MATGLCGIGVMGRRMGSNLLAAGFDLHVWNRTSGPEDALVEAGATRAGSPVELARACEVVITMLAGDDSVDEVVFGRDGLTAELAPGSVVLNMSTTSIEFAHRAAAQLDEQGFAFVDAPVFGSSAEAEAGSLWAVAGAHDETLARVRPQLDAMCAAVHHLGPPGSGTTMKLAGNLMVAGMIDLLGEAMTLAERGGLPPTRFVEVLSTIDFRSPIYDAKGAAMVAGDFTPGWPLKHAVKDVVMAREAGRRLGLPMRALDGILAEYEAAEAMGHGDQDVSAVRHASSEAEE